VAEPEFDFRLLAPLTAKSDILETEYLQVLTGPEPVKEWVNGTWLKQFLDQLDVAERAAFETDYARRLRSVYR
jgi:trans-aconitate 2-methyltransferase